MAIWKEAPAEVIDVARRLIDEFHQDIDGANIAILMKEDEHPKPAGLYKVWAQASKIPAKFQALLDYDFLILIQVEVWDRLDENGKKALLDHELCHCGFNENDVPVMIDHEIEEFACVIERHGLWRKSLVEFGMVVDNAVEKYMQNPLFKKNMSVEIKSGGRVATLTGEQLAAWQSRKAL